MIHIKDANGNIVLTDADKRRIDPTKANKSIRAKNHSIKCGYSTLLLVCSREEGHPGTHYQHLTTQWFGLTKEGILRVFDGGDLDT